MGRYETWRLRAVVVWAIVGALALFVLGVRGLAIVGQAVELLLIGIIVGFVCSPTTNWLEDHRVPRGLAAVISVLGVLAALVVLVALFMGPFLRELMVLLRNVPSYVSQLQGALTAFWDTFGVSGSSNVQNLVNAAVEALSEAGTSIASDLARGISQGLFVSLTDIAGHVVTIFLGMILACWLALDYPKIMRELAIIAGPEYDEEMVLTFAVLSRSMGGYMRGTLITSLANGAMVAAGLALLGHPYAGLLGIATFVLHFVPVIGPMLSSVSAVLLGLFVSPVCAFWTLVITVVAQNVRCSPCRSRPPSGASSSTTLRPAPAASSSPRRARSLAPRPSTTPPAARAPPSTRLTMTPSSRAPACSTASPASTRT